MDKVLVCILSALCLLCELGHVFPTSIPLANSTDLIPGKAGFGYLLTMPQKLQAGGEEKYCLTLQNVLQDETISLKLHAVDKPIVKEYTHTYVNGESQCNLFQVPPEPGTYKVKLHNGVVSFAESQVTVVGNNLITFVQTDKPIYKPGQTVKFRILTMKKDLKSRMGLIETVMIKDPNNFNVKQYKNTESKGMASLEFQLISDAKLGEWTIEVTVEGETTTMTFKVEEYVLPRFEVSVEPPPYFLVTSPTFDGKVCANYTYGKPVRGYLTLLVCLHQYYGYDQSCALRQTEIDGCYSYSISSSEIMSSDRHFYGQFFNIKASVMEAETGVQVNGSAKSPTISYEALKLEFIDATNGYFKLGFPVEGKIKVSRPDGTPAANEKVKLTARDSPNNIYMEKTFTSNQLGEIQYAVCQGIKDNTSSLSLHAEAFEYNNEEQGVSYGRRMYTPSAHKNLRQWFSPSLSYIQIPASFGELQCGKKFSVRIPYTHDGLKPAIMFHYQVMARGRIIQTGIVNAVTTLDPIASAVTTGTPCLEVKDEPTPPPPPTEAPIADSSNETETDDDDTLAIGKVEEPEAPELEPPSLPQSRPRERQKLIERQPLDMPTEEEPALAETEIQPLSETFDDDIVRRRKRSYVPRGPWRGSDEAEPIVRSENVAEFISVLELTLDVTASMSPSFSLLIFYVRDDGETIADSMDFKVTPCFDNKVKMEFSARQVSPGEQVTIHLEAAAGSVCGIGVVDKSVNILGGDHQITPAKVFDKLKEYDLSSQGGYSYYMSVTDYCRDRMKKKQKEEKEKKKESVEGEDDDDDDEDVEETIMPYANYWYTSNYVDAIEAFKKMGMLVMTNLVIETRPCFKQAPYYFGDPVALFGGEVFMMQGLPGPPQRMPSFIQTGSSRLPDSTKETDVRSKFPETWLWDLKTVGETGSIDIPHKVPDTITQWVGNSMCIDEEAGFGISAMTNVTTFKPFFLSFNLPYNAVRGEKIPITVTVYNYLDKCLHMQLLVDGLKKFKVQQTKTSKQPFCLCAGKSETKKYFIVANDIGELPIFARAEVVPGHCSNAVEMDSQYVGTTDAVERKVLVKAEGVTQRYSNSLYVCPGEEVYRDSFSLPLPLDMVPDSGRGEVTVIGDIMGPALSNLDSLVRMPTGCGEQNMVGFTPNIYVLQYLTATGQLTGAIEDKAKNFMEIGYQRELKYRHSDGSYSAFGESGNKPGSTWLTAFVVKSFAQAKPYIFIDDKDLNRSMEYLTNIQNPEDGPLRGCFFERGTVFQSYMQGGLGQKSNEATLSAYVLIALLQAGLSPQDRVAVDGIACVNREVQNMTDVDTYTLSLVAYVNTLYNPRSAAAATVMATLYSRVTNDGAVRYWKRQGELPKPVNSWHYYSAPSAEVEMTSYALLATIKYYGKNAISEAQPTAFWLSNQQSAFGGFSSTQDTVLGLNALSEFATLAYSDKPTNLQLIVAASGRSSFNQSFTVNVDNSLELQRHPFKMAGDGSMLFVTAIGTGCALVQASISYNKLPDKMGIEKSPFSLKVEPKFYQHDRNQCHRRTIHIKFRQNSGQDFSSGMTLLTVRMVTGWSVVPESLKQLQGRFSILGIERYELDVEQGMVNFYLDSLNTGETHLALDVEQLNRDLMLSNAKPAEVQIYQYYEKDVTMIKSYQLKTTCGTKEELPFDEPLVVGNTAQQRLPLGSPPTGLVSRASTAVDARQLNCPVCNMETTPANYNEIVCASTAVYKAHSGREKRYSLKIKANLRPRKKVQNINQFVSLTMNANCTCPLLGPPKKTVLIITQADNLKESTLTVDSRTYVFDVKKDKTLEKKTRKAQQKCKLN